ncbi:hypothetical protein CSUI_001817, partial [Cystoisospora suis]
MKTAAVFLLLGALWATAGPLRFEAQTQNDAIVCVSAARAPARTAFRAGSPAAHVPEDEPEPRTAVVRRKNSRAPTSRKSRPLSRPGKLVAVVGAAAGLFFSAMALWKCRTAVFGARRSQAVVTGPAASRRLADNAECV